MNPTIKFSRVDSAKFFKTLNKRVNSYFKENGIKKPLIGLWHMKAIRILEGNTRLMIASELNI